MSFCLKSYWLNYTAQVYEKIYINSIHIFYGLEVKLQEFLQN